MPESASRALSTPLTKKSPTVSGAALTERERRVLRAPRQRASRRERDRAIMAADAAGYTRQEIARTFGLSRTSVSRILLRAADMAGR